MSTRFPGRRLSLPRLGLLIAIVLALIVGGVFATLAWRDGQRADRNEPWFAAYVDATVTPYHAFETPLVPADKRVVLSFIVAPDASTCAATWGTYYSPEDALTGLDLDRRIARLRQSGGDIVVSFGGQANTDLALACGSAEALAEQYRAIIARYRPVAIDLDIEGEALADATSRTRRAQAFALLQRDEDPLPVWLTLPVGPSGLTPDGVATVQSFLESGVPLAGVNAMTMNFTETDDSAATSIDALRATHRQLMAMYADRGESLGERTAWRMIGTTPMIGQNDVPGEVFTLDDARTLSTFAAEVGLGRMSMWSANRDRSCASAYADLTVVSNSCSGIDQGGERFATLLGAGFTGAPDGTLPSPAAATAVRPETITDDPSTSPYPVWDPEASYPADTRVVWRHNVYQAKWWSTRSQPDDPTIAEADSAWRLVGPVLPGETPQPQLALPGDFYPGWDPAASYEKGHRILFEGLAYEAKWWSQGDNPASGQKDPGASPWRALTQDEIEKLLAGG